VQAPTLAGHEGAPHPEHHRVPVRSLELVWCPARRSRARLAEARGPHGSTPTRRLAACTFLGTVAIGAYRPPGKTGGVCRCPERKTHLTEATARCPQRSHAPARHIFQCFVQAGPGPFTAWRERPFENAEHFCIDFPAHPSGETARRCHCQITIHRVTSHMRVAGLWISASLFASPLQALLRVFSSRRKLLTVMQRAPH
jgi:hypothetical protein